MTTANQLEGRMLIDGRWEQGRGDFAEDRDPGNGELVGRLPMGTRADVDRAVDAATRAAPSWRTTPPSKRGGFLVAAADRLAVQTDDWAQLMAREMGKPVAEAKVECQRAGAILRYFAGEAHRPFGEQFSSDMPQTWLFTRRDAVGVVGIVTPWNFPAAIPVWKLAPALVFGNTVVLKLAGDAALTGLRLVEALHDVGLPPGVLNVVVGPGSEVGAAIVEHPGIDAITFTGSTVTGRGILEKAARGAKRVQLEMGGHNPVIVRADANVESALAAVALGAFASAGQKCTATRRVYVARPLYEQFADGLAERARDLRVGYPLDETTEMGPLVNESQLGEVLDAVDRAAKQGEILTGGHRLEEGDYGRGCYMEPTVLVGLPHDAEIACEEVFGPATALWPYDDDEEALRLANRTNFDLSAAIFTRDLDAAKSFVERIEAGIVHVNSQTAGAEVHVPFGGLAGSGYGPHEQGRAAIEFFTRQKTVYLDPAG